MKIIAGVIVSGCLYVLVAAKLGEYTFPQHVMRIARTPEAQELGAGIWSKVTRVQRSAQSEIRERLASSRPESEPESR